MAKVDPIALYDPRLASLRRRPDDPAAPQPQAFVKSYLRQHLRGLVGAQHAISAAPLKIASSVEYFSCGDKSSATAVLNDDYCDCR